MLFVPLSDDNPLRFLRYQWVTISIIAINIAVYISQASGLLVAVGSHLSVIPSELLQSHGANGSAYGPFDPASLPKLFSLVSYMFLHVDVLHLASNMIFLWVFGDNVEDAMGHLRYLLFYLLCGVIAALAHVLVQPTLQVPLMGASGAVAGTIAAYLILHPRVLVWVVAFRVLPLRITAIWMLGVWAITQVIMVLIKPGDAVAWWAHIGGLLAGAALVPLMRRAEVPLLDRGMTPIDADRDTWWREYRAAIFHRGLMRLAKPLRYVVSLGRYLRITTGKHLRSARSWLGAPSEVIAPDSQPVPEVARARYGPEVLRLERRGEHFALVRSHRDGSRSELELTDANVVHLGLLAPGFAREVLEEKAGHAATTAGSFVRNKAASTGLRAVEILIAILDKGGERLDLSMTERRSRALATRLMERADRIARTKAPTSKTP